MKITKRNLIKIIKEVMSQEYIDKAEQYEKDELAKNKSDRKSFSRAYKKAHVEEINSYDLSKFVGLHLISAFTGESRTVGGKIYKSFIPDSISYLAKNLNVKNPGEQSVYIKRKNDIESIKNNAAGASGFSVILTGHWTGMYRSDAMTDMGSGPNTRKYYGGRDLGNRFLNTQEFAYGREELTDDSYDTAEDEGVIAGAEITGIIFSSKHLIDQFNLFNEGYIGEMQFKKLREDTNILINKLQSFSGTIIDLDNVVKNVNDLIKILSSLNEARVISPEEKQKAIDKAQEEKKKKEEFEIYKSKYNKIKSLRDGIGLTLELDTPSRTGKQFWLYNKTSNKQFQNIMSAEEIFNIIIDDIYSDYVVYPQNEGKWKNWTAIAEIAVLAKGKIPDPE